MTIKKAKELIHDDVTARGWQVEVKKPTKNVRRLIILRTLTPRRP